MQNKELEVEIENNLKGEPNAPYLRCKRCKRAFAYAVPNRKDGTFICYCLTNQ